MLPVLPSNLRVFKVIKCCNLYFMVNYPVILRTIGCKANYLNYYTTLQSIKLNGASTIIMIYQLLLIHGGKKKDCWYFIDTCDLVIWVSESWMYSQFLTKNDKEMKWIVGLVKIWLVKMFCYKDLYICWYSSPPLLRTLLSKATVLYNYQKISDAMR